MIAFQRKMGPFKIKDIWFSDDVYDVEDVDAVQFRNANISVEKSGFTKEISTTLTIDLTKSLDDIWNAMDKKSCQKNISKALADSSYVVRFNERYEEFDEINREFRKRKGLPSAMISIDEMKKSYFLCTFEKDGVLLGGHICIRDDQRIRQLISGTSMTPESAISGTTFARANRLAMWEMIKHAKQEGLVEYDFGGYATGEMADELRGINEFKASFGGVERKKSSYTKSYSKLFDASRSFYLSAASTRHRLRNIGWGNPINGVKKAPENVNGQD
jgi:hypothetical protein